MTAPTEMALVPAEATEPCDWPDSFPHCLGSDQDCPSCHGHLAGAELARRIGEIVAASRAALASPSSGRLTAADLERAAEAHYTAAWDAAIAAGMPLDAWSDLMPGARQAYISRQRAAFAAIGLQVEGEPQASEEWIRDPLDASKPLPPYAPASKKAPS